jgi:hypothetical protein
LLDRRHKLGADREYVCQGGRLRCRLLRGRFCREWYAGGGHQIDKRAARASLIIRRIHIAPIVRHNTRYRC